MKDSTFRRFLASLLLVLSSYILWRDRVDFISTFSNTPTSPFITGLWTKIALWMMYSLTILLASVVLLILIGCILLSIHVLIFGKIKKFW
jgi:hypothetical protein